jgi:hypothetical protein
MATKPRRSAAHHLQGVVRLHAAAAAQLRLKARSLPPGREREITLENAHRRQLAAEETRLLLVRRDVAGGSLLTTEPPPRIRTPGRLALGTRRLGCDRPAHRRSSRSTARDGPGDKPPGHRPSPSLTGGRQ